MQIYKKYLLYLVVSNSCCMATESIHQRAKKYHEYLYQNPNFPKCYLVSFPKSGNTWMRYCLEYLTKRPTLPISFYKDGRHSGHYNIMRYPHDFRHPLNVDYLKFPIIKCHFPEQIFNEKFLPFDKNNDILILLIRNYKEVIPSHMNKLEVSKFYFNILEAYENWNPANRILIYYEDFISNPEVELVRLLQFLNEPPKYLINFLENYKFHKTQCINDYAKNISKPITQGNTALFYSKKYSITELIEIDEKIKKMYPILAKKYLTRYFENL